MYINKNSTAENDVKIQISNNTKAINYDEEINNLYI